MKKRVIGFIAALVLALVGTTLLVAYVKGAEDRALAGETIVEVYVAQSRIDQGTPGEDIEDMVLLERIPTKVQVEGAVAALEDIVGLVAAVDLLPGEQITLDRFVARTSLSRYARAQDAPPGYLEMTMSLSPERFVGGSVNPGDTVAIVASFDPFELGGAPVGETPEGDPLVEIDGILVPADTKTPNSTHIVLEGVLVTNVQVEELPVVEESVDGAPVSRRALAPSGNLLISVALSAEDAERVIFGAEHGQLWFARQTSDIDIRDTQVLTRGRIYEGLFR